MGPVGEPDPLVSVVVPTFGRAGLLADAVRSVRDQTYDRLELLIVDDRSPEPVAPVVEGLALGGFDVEVIRHEENRGANAARNTGIRAAKGEFVAFLDDDDRWRPTLVERHRRAFREGGEDVGLSTVGMAIVNGEGERIGTTIPRLSGDPIEALIDGVNVGSFSRLMVRSTVIEAAGLPDERLPSWQDWEWQFRLARHCRFVAVPEPLVVRREADHGQITDDFEQRRDISYPLLVRKHRSTAASRGRRAERRFIALLSRSLGFSALSTGHYREAPKHLLRALRYDPLAWETYLYLVLALGGPYTYLPARRLKQQLSHRITNP